MKIAVVLPLLLFPFSFYSQTTPPTGTTQEVLEYTYDPSGNRVLRKIITIVLRPSDSTTNENLQLSEEILEDSLSTEQSTLKNSEVLEDNVGGYTVNIYPNPTKGRIMVEIPEIANANQATLRMYDVAGKMLKDLSIKEINNSIDLTPFRDGSYILFININGKTLQWTIIKTN